MHSYLHFLKCATVYQAGKNSFAKTVVNGKHVSVDAVANDNNN